MGATHQPIGQTAAACDWPEPMNADRQCRQTPNLAPGVFGQRPHRWVCHRGRTNITLAGSHYRGPRAIVFQAGLQASPCICLKDGV